MLAERYESNKFYDAFDGNAQLVMGEPDGWNKFYDACDGFDGFDFDAHLVVAEHY